MCAERLLTLSKAQSIAASLTARSRDVAEARLLYQSAVQLVQRAALLAPQSVSRIHSAYLQYWHCGMEGRYALLSGAFADSRSWFARASATTDDPKVTPPFPNFYANKKEAKTQTVYVDAVDKVASGDFLGAARTFGLWNTLNADHKGGIRPDNVFLFEQICTYIATISDSTSEPATWENLKRLLLGRYVARTTWVLWARIQAVHFQVEALRARKVSRDRLANVIATLKADIAREWRLFVFETPLEGVDRAAGLQGDLVLPTFLDVFGRLDPSIDQWQDILEQNIHHAFMLMADYEAKFEQDPPAYEKMPAPLAEPPIPAGSTTTDELIKIFRVYLERRSTAHLRYFDEALKKLVEFRLAVKDGDFQRAVEAQVGMLAKIRRLPAVVRISGYDEGQKAVIAKRIWNQSPADLTLLEADHMGMGDFYYLRPRWNTKSLAGAVKLRHDDSWPASLPRTMDIFCEGVFGRGFANGERFQRWVLQFSTTERLIACKLLDGFRYYDETRFRAIWMSVFRKLPVDVQRVSPFVGLGAAAKSGNLSMYFLRQALLRDAEVGEMFSDASVQKRRFRNLDEIRRDLTLAEPVVFVEDFACTGRTSAMFVREALGDAPRFPGVPCYLCIPVAFESAVRYLKDNVVGRGVDELFVGEVVPDSERAFAPSNPIWKSAAERESAREWARVIGERLEPGVALGYKESEARVAFFYNTPDNTLPLFWSTREVGGVAWQSLFDRY